MTSIDKAAWRAELDLHTELFTQLAYHLPAELTATKAQLEAAPGWLIHRSATHKKARLMRAFCCLRSG